jgi:hypothetical protein
MPFMIHCDAAGLSAIFVSWTLIDRRKGGLMTLEHRICIRRGLFEKAPRCPCTDILRRQSTRELRSSQVSTQRTFAVSLALDFRMDIH